MNRRNFLGSVAGAASLAAVVGKEVPAETVHEPEESLPGEPLVFNMCCCNLMPAIVHRVSQMKPTLYRMHAAQSFQLWQLAMLIRDSVPEFTDITSADWSVQKICGVPCESVDDFPKDQVWLYRGRHVIAKIVHLAVPPSYAT